jgi:maltooligosyltrehalose trehalohydrolase
MTRHASALQFGATLLEPGRARFRLWAPGAPRVELLLDGSPPQPLRALEDGWHELDAPASAGTRYRYRVGAQVVPDPASRAQDGGPHGASIVVDPRAYEWRHDWHGRPWTETVLYELHVAACGGYAGVVERLPVLAELGVTALELMPLADVPGARNWGYDGVLPFAPAAALGPPEALKALVDAAHGHGLMVFLDVVYNHFGPDGNFLPAYAPGFFRADVPTPWGAAIDFRRRAVRDFFIQNACYWLEEYRFDGLRLDAVHAITDETFLDELAARVRGELAAAEPGRVVHLVLENEHNAARRLGPGRFDAQWNDDAHNALHVLLTGEREGYYRAYAERPAACLARCLAEGFCWQGEPFPGRATLRGEPSAHLPPSAFVFFLQNHDQVGNRAQGERLTMLAEPDALRAAIALQLLCPQVPLLFMGEDWGSRVPFLFFTDFHGELADAVREGRRREFAKFAAWADPAARARIPDPNDPGTFRRSQPDFDAATASPRRAEYRELLRLRREHVIPHLAGARAQGAQVLAERAVEGRWRLGDGRTLRIAANLGAEPVALEPFALAPLYATAPAALAATRAGRLEPRSTVAWLGPAGG